MKICVYGLVHNIGDRAAAWIQHLRDADYIILGDIGSTDNSHINLEQCGAKVYNLNINPWRYDVARNTLLSLLPADVDIAIACDFNQTLSANWRNILAQNWLPGTTKLQCKHKYANGEYEKSCRIHTAKGYHWIRPIYECLNSKDIEQIVTTNEITISDDFDNNLGNTHQLLEQSINENPNDGEILFKLARSWAYMAHWQTAIDVHKRNVESGDSTLYRSESMIHLSGLEHQELPYWLAQAVVECPWRRETWYELACYYYRQYEWNLCLSHCLKALSLGCTRPNSDAIEKKFLVQVNDMASMSAWNCNMLETSVKYAEAAAKLDPADGRLQNNLVIIRNIINSAIQRGGSV